MSSGGSALGHYRTRHISCLDVRLAANEQTFISLLAELALPVCNKKFPVPTAGNSSKKSCVSMGLCKRGGAFQRKFPVFSRGSGNFIAETRSLQPPSTATKSRGFWLSPDLRGSVPEKPRNQPPNGGRSLGSDARETVWVGKSHGSPSLSLQATFGGHTCRGADAPNPLSIMTEPSRHHQSACPFLGS